MQPCGREMQSINSILNQQFDPTHDEFLDQILSSVPSNSWPPDLSSVTGGNNAGTSANKPHQAQAQAQAPPWDNLSQTHLGGDASLEDRSTTNSLASKLRQHQIGSSKALMFQQQLMLSSGLASDSASGNNGLRSPTTENGGFLPMPLHSNGDHDDISPFDSAHSANDASVQALYDQFTGSLGQPSNQLHHFQRARGAVIQAHQNIGATMNIQSAIGSGSTGTGGEGGPALQPKQQRVRARRGQATDPHSIAERLRRERIAERMKALQELVPNANKTDKASMLDEIVDYVKFLQLQVKVLSMSRLGGAATVAPRAAVMSSEVGEAVQGNGRSSNGTAPPTAAASSSNDTMTVTEHQVAKLMEEDMGSAMQYLQGKGLCLMPISLATAISTATCQQPRNSNLLRHHNTTNNNHNHHNHHHVGLGSGGNGVGDGSGGPSSPNISGLTVQSATLGADPSVKDAASVSKP